MQIYIPGGGRYWVFFLFDFLFFLGVFFFLLRVSCWMGVKRAGQFRWKNR